MWQKARIIRNGYFPQLRGRTVWTIGGRREQFCNDLAGIEYRDTDFVDTNLRQGSQIVGLDGENLELLPEFAEDVPLVSWEDFLRQAAIPPAVEVQK